jgi:uncharacterized protein YraI
MATVRRDTDQDQINVRSGPSVKYDIIGVLVPGQQIPALGRTPGDWVQILYVSVPGSVGWVYSPLVELNGNTHSRATTDTYSQNNTDYRSHSCCAIRR